MNSSPSTADLFSVNTLPDTPACALPILELLSSVATAHSAELAIEMFSRLRRLIGADSGVFLSTIKDDAARTSIRSLLACDPQWAIEYSRIDWHASDPWLRHALASQAPIRGEELAVLPREQAFVQRSAMLGFASTIVVPAHSCFGTARVGVLILGSNQAGFFGGVGYQLVRVVARALAMELHEWMLQAIRNDLLERSRITPDEIDLLRHEAAGHTSKMIAAALNMKARTVDCRFQRVNAKLNAPDRRTAMRIARLYGLL